MIMVWERYCNASAKPELYFIFFVYILIHISANMNTASQLNLALDDSPYRHQ